MTNTWKLKVGISNNNHQQIKKENEQHMGTVKMEGKSPNQLLPLQVAKELNGRNGVKVNHNLCFRIQTQQYIFHEYKIKLKNQFLNIESRMK